jgi:hypothetical protein
MPASSCNEANMTPMTCRALGFAICLPALAGCMDREPYHRTDVWRPTGSNAANLAAMVADPHDLIAGRGAGRENVKPYAAALDRVWNDQQRSLTPSAGVTSGKSGDGGGGGGGAAPAGGESSISVPQIGGSGN